MFQIGEFSRLAMLSVRVLRHYDEIGLLRPARTDPASGRRSYSAEQLADVNRIVALKALGLSLAQVRKLMHERVDAEEVAAMLRLETARAEQDLAAARSRLADLARLTAEVGAGGLPEVDIVVKSVPATPYLAYRTTVANLTAAGDLLDQVAAAGARLSNPGPLVVIGHDDFFPDADLDIEVGYGVSGPELDIGRGRRLTPGLLPALERSISTTVIAGHDDAHRRAHATIGHWLQAHHCVLAGPGREIVRPQADQVATVEILYPVAEVGKADRR